MGPRLAGNPLKIVVLRTPTLVWRRRDELRLRRGGEPGGKVWFVHRCKPCRAHGFRICIS